MNEAEELIRKILLAAALLAGLIAFGTTGYMHIMGWSFIDSLWMTGITITTVGFGEVHPLDFQGRIFTLFIMAIGIGIAFWSFSLLVQLIVGEELKDLMWRSKMAKKITSFKNHYIICGYNAVGKSIAEIFAKRSIPFVVIDNSQESIKLLKVQKFSFVEGAPQSDNALVEAGISDAKSVIVAGVSEAENIVVVLSARCLNRDVMIIAQATDEESEQKLKRAGADVVISPFAIGARRIASVALRPTVVDFLDTVMHVEGFELEVEEIPVEKAGAAVGKSIIESRIKSETGAIIIGIRKTSGQLKSNPLPTELLEVGDKIIAIGSEQHLDRLWHLLSGAHRK